VHWSTRCLHDTLKTSQVRGVKLCLVCQSEAKERSVFRELLQNADDAEASEAQIEFQTSDYAKNSARTSEKSGTTPDLSTIRVSFRMVLSSNPR